LVISQFDTFVASTFWTDL